MFTALMKCSTALAAAAIVLLGATAAACAQTIPADHADALAAYVAAQENLPLIERSDWINVKTDVEPTAVGDGVADDTVALQAALDKLSAAEAGSRGAIYLPPGEYRITDTLTITKRQGGAIYGHGRATRIVWDGGEGRPGKTRFNADILRGASMIESNGFSRATYFGLTFDGRGKAAVGVDHHSRTLYETRVRYQYCAFYNFTDSGIRIGHNQKLATAETMFFDTYFENCRRGVSMLDFNDYNNAFIRCVFKDSETAIFCHRGNVYVQDSHFENSSKRDILLPPHSHSVRRCTSTGSAAFIEPSQPGHYPLMLHVQDCVVEGWSSRRGAIRMQNGGPILVFDSVFGEPADAEAPVFWMNDPYTFSPTLMLANVRYPEGVTRVRDETGGPEPRIIEIPRNAPAVDVTEHLAKRWSHRPELPDRVVDAVAEFGADPTGRSDSTQAIQQTIDAAATYEGGLAEAYLPVGTYAISDTLRLGPGRYHFAGSQFHRTRIVPRNLHGFGDRVLIHAHNADGVTLHGLRLEGPRQADLLGLHVTADRPGSMTIDAFASEVSHSEHYRGGRFEALPAGFNLRVIHYDGSLDVVDCGDADLLFDYLQSGYFQNIVFDGPSGEGFMGVQFLHGSVCNPDLELRRNASLVASDFYTEQTTYSILATGDPDLPPGRVTLPVAKMAGYTDQLIKIRGYRGQITHARGNVLREPNNEERKRGVKAVDLAATVAGKNNEHTHLLLLGNACRYLLPKIELDGGEVAEVGSMIWMKDNEPGIALIPNRPEQPDWDVVNAALDHLHELSLATIEANHRGSPER